MVPRNGPKDGKRRPKRGQKWDPNPEGRKMGPKMGPESMQIWINSSGPDLLGSLLSILCRCPSCSWTCADLRSCRIKQGLDNLIKFAIKQPIAVAAMVLLIIAFGFVSLQKIPIQMTPDIDKPVLQVRVSWPGASPKDDEREVVTRDELAVS